MATTYDFQRNYRSFNAVVDGYFGRRIIRTNVQQITKQNIVEELSKALAIHYLNQRAIGYLDRYYRGDQPILYRKKAVRQEINNKVVENHAFEIVESKVADLFGEPVQYVLRVDDKKQLADEIRDLNTYLDSEDKGAMDIERGRWASICGTSYIFVGGSNRAPKDYDEAPFYLKVEDPYYTFVCYYADDDTPAFSCQIREGSDGGTYYYVYTASNFYTICDGEIKWVTPNGNGGMLPVIEYPNNERRLSDIEITITMTDELNKMQSDRMNGIEQFVQAFTLFKNCDIDKNKFLEMCAIGAVSVKSTTSGYDADVKMLSSQLDQNSTQTSKDDIYQNLLIVQGKPGRQEQSSGDTGQAVALRNGYYDESKRAELRVPCFKRAERMMLKVVLNKLRVNKQFTLKISDIEIKPKRSKLENMMVKAQVLQILHQVGIDDAEAIKLVNLFGDPQQVIAASEKRMKDQFDSSNKLGDFKQNTSNQNTLGNQQNDQIDKNADETNKQKNADTDDKKLV